MFSFRVELNTHKTRARAKEGIESASCLHKKIKRLDI